MNFAVLAFSEVNPDNVSILITSLSTRKRTCGAPPAQPWLCSKKVRFRYSLENSPKSKVYVWDSVPKPVPKSTSRYSPMLAGFETRFPRAPAFFPPASNLQGRRGGSIDFYVCAHEYSSPLEYAAS
jgi:hypothetical protein